MEHKIWGFSPRWAGYCERVRRGDRVVIYTSENHSYTVICEVTKECFIDPTPIWPDGEYLHRIGIEPLPVSQKPVTLQDVRAFARNPKFGMSFMPAIASVTPEDFSIIQSMMTKK